MDFEKKYKEALERARIWKDKSGMPKDKQGILDDIFPELKEPEDERIRRAIIELVKFYYGSSLALKHTVSKDDMFAWLEKQGEQELQGKTALEAINEEKVDNQNCVKTTDKVEPKFKVGDWIIRSAEGYKHNTYLVTEVKDYYVCEELKGRRVTFTFNDVHKNFKLWDVSDAKDGDVLVDKYNNIGIFQECKGICWYSYIYFGCDGKLHIFIGGSHVQTDTHPATKEQCDLLFAKMKEAGYEWDFEKKELKEIRVIDKGKAEMNHCFTKMMNGEKVSPAWSEENEKNLQGVIDEIEANKSYAEDCDIPTYDRILNWLKSLKEKLK